MNCQIHKTTTTSSKIRKPILKMNKAQDLTSTPKFCAPPPIKTSTVDKNKGKRRVNLEHESIDSSLGILSLNNVDLSNIVSDMSGASNIEEILEHQRLLAGKTLEKEVNRVSAIPSKFLRPELGQTNNESSFNNIPTESTVNESDLLSTPKINTSTPRNSVDLEDNPLKSPQPRESIFSRFKDILDSNVSTHQAFEEFQQIAQASKNLNQSEIGSVCSSVSYIPGQQAESELDAAELSWQHKYGIPPSGQTYTTFRESSVGPSVSIGAFFAEKVPDLSCLRAPSPTKVGPIIPLIDQTCSTTVANDELTKFNSKDTEHQKKSLSISAIQDFIAKVPEGSAQVYAEYLINKNKKIGEAEQDSINSCSIPVSVDCSYSTTHSDNEDIRAAVNENKENILPLVNRKLTLSPEIHSDDSNEMKKSFTLTSARTSSSLTNLPDGKLPIESTVNELIWGCVKIDRCVTKQFTLRNRTSKTVRLQCSMNTQDFKIRKDSRSDSDHLSTFKFVLHGHETRPLIISFIPTKNGPAIDELSFTPMDSNLKQTKKQSVRLWGYGGFTSNDYQNVSRDNTGKFWLSLGRMDNRVSIEQPFIIKNVGNLPSFTYIKILPKHVVTFTTIKVEPSLFVLLPNEEKKVMVTYTPTAKDCLILKQNLNVMKVVDIGKLEIISGAEVNRGRLKRLSRKRIEKNLPVDELTKVLISKMSNELINTRDVRVFKETPNGIDEILETFNIEEMIITLEQDPNQTLVAECPEDSVIYQTLCLENTAIFNESIVKLCRLEPTLIVFCPPTKVKDNLFLISDDTIKAHYFEVKSTLKGLQIKPQNGSISPKETVEFTVKLPSNSVEGLYRILIYIENDIYDVELKVLKSSKHFLG